MSILPEAIPRLKRLRITYANQLFPLRKLTARSFRIISPGSNQSSRIRERDLNCRQVHTSKSIFANRQSRTVAPVSYSGEFSFRKNDFDVTIKDKWNFHFLAKSNDAFTLEPNQYVPQMAHIHTQIRSVSAIKTVIGISNIFASWLRLERLSPTTLLDNKAHFHLKSYYSGSD